MTSDAPAPDPDAPGDDESAAERADGSEADASAVDAPEVDAELEDQEQVEEHELAWQIPEITMVPLAIVLSGLLMWAFWFDRVLVALVPFACLMAAITIIDLRELRIPNKLTRPGSVVAVPLLAIAATSAWPDVSLWRALLVGAVMWLGYFIVVLIQPKGMGWGDVKLSLIIGAQLGLFGWVPAGRGVMAAFLINGPLAIVLLLMRKAGRKTALPFGPFMAAGAIVALLLEGFSA